VSGEFEGVLKDQAWDVIDTMAQKYQGSFDWIVVEPRGWLQRWKTMIESQFLFGLRVVTVRQHALTACGPM